MMPVASVAATRVRNFSFPSIPGAGVILSALLLRAGRPGIVGFQGRFKAEVVLPVPDRHQHGDRLALPGDERALAGVGRPVQKVRELAPHLLRRHAVHSVCFHRFYVK